MKRAALLVTLCLSASAFAAELELVRGPLQPDGLAPAVVEYQALMPAGAQGEALRLELPDGLAYVSAWGGSADGRLYSVTSSDYPASSLEAKDPEALLREVMLSMVRQLGATEAYEKPIKLGAAKGYAVKAKSSRGPVNARFYFVSGRLLGLLVIGEPNATTKKFLKSLKLVGEQKSMGKNEDAVM